MLVYILHASNNSLLSHVVSVNVSCNRVPNDWYFSFYMNWTIPGQVAFKTAIEGFEIWKHLVDLDGNTVDHFSIQTEDAKVGGYNLQEYQDQ